MGGCLRAGSSSSELDVDVQDSVVEVMSCSDMLVVSWMSCSPFVRETSSARWEGLVAEPGLKNLIVASCHEI